MLLFRTQKQSVADEDPAFLPDGWPTGDVRERCIIAERRGITGRLKRIIIDPVKRWVYFEHCHVSNTFFTLGDRFFACPVSDLHYATEVPTKFGCQLRILSIAGKAEFTGPGIHRVLGLLEELGVPELGGPELRSPAVLTVAGLYGTAFGLAAGLTVSLPVVGEFPMVIIGLGGAFGVALCLLVIWLGQKLFGFRLVNPMAGLLITSPIGGLLGYLCQQLLGAEFPGALHGPTILKIFTVGGALLGATGGAVIFGLIQQDSENTAEQVKSRRESVGRGK